MMPDWQWWCRLRVVVPDGTTWDLGMVGGRRAPDIGTVDRLAHLALLAARAGCKLALSDVSPHLGELLDLAGLGIEMQWEPEGGEEALRIEEGEEEAHVGDGPT